MANCLNISVSCLGILLETEYKLKSAYGLSNLGLMNDFAKTRKIDRQNAFATHVIDSDSSLVIDNTLSDSFFWAKSSHSTLRYRLLFRCTLNHLKWPVLVV